MSGSGPGHKNDHPQSKFTKPLQEAVEYNDKHATTDGQFKKTTHVVGKPQVTDHNIADDYIKNPPRNIPGDPTGDISIGRGEPEAEPQPDTVTAKDPAEIQSRIDAGH